MVIPAILAIVIPIFVGLLDATGMMLGGLLVGCIASGVVFGIFMVNSGGAWDNAKKQVEDRIKKKT